MHTIPRDADGPLEPLARLWLLLQLLAQRGNLLQRLKSVAVAGREDPLADTPGFDAALLRTLEVPTGSKRVAQVETAACNLGRVAAFRHVLEYEQRALVHDHGVVKVVPTGYVRTGQARGWEHVGT